jgi:hypothetical protein
MATTNEQPIELTADSMQTLSDTIEAALDGFNRQRIGRGAHALQLCAAIAWALRQSDIQHAHAAEIAARWLATVGDQDAWFAAGQPYYAEYLADTARLRYDHPNYQSPFALDAEPEILPVGD